jgi:hypothetical protein
MSPAVAAKLAEPRISSEHEANLMRWRADPLAFCYEALGLREYLPGKILTPDQEQMFALVRDNKRVAISSANAVGKSYGLAALALWFLVTNVNSWVVTTSASWELVKNVLWREIRDMYMRAKIPLGGTLLDTSLEFGDKWVANGISTDSATRFQGKHAGRVLIIGDESTGIDRSIFEAAEFMTVSPDDRLVFVGNPTDPSSDFYQECFSPEAVKSGKWKTFEISALHHPNVTYGRILIHGAVTRELVEEQLRFLGADHPAYEARVLGRWSKKGGRMFAADWDARRHVYDPREVVLPDWLPRWISLDWGFAHNAAALFLAFDGKTLYVEDELVINEKTASQLGELIGMRANPQAAYGQLCRYKDVYLAHDMFARMGVGNSTAFRTRAEEFDEASQAFGLPPGLRAAIDRVSGWNLITALLRTDGIKVSKLCGNLIAKIPEAKRDPKHPEDMLKLEGDDEMDALYKAVLARPTEPQLPAEVRINRAVTGATPHDRAMQARIARSNESTAGEQGYVNLRRGYREG